MSLRPDLLIHCAGGSDVGDSFFKPHADFRRSALTASAVLEYVRTTAPACKVSFASSASVYGIAETLPISEQTPLRPISPYGHHKVFVEQLASYYAKDFKISATMVRLFSVYGIGLEKQLFWDACNKLARGVRIFDGTGEECRDWLHVIDAARLLVTAAENATSNFLIMNGGSGVATPVRDALNTIAATFGGPPVDFSGSSRRGDPTSYEADIRRASSLGWKPQVTLTEGLNEYVEHFKRTRL